MSEHKQAGVAASVNTGMVMGGTGRPGRGRLHVKLWGIVLFVVLVLCGAGWLAHGHARKEAGSKTKTHADQKYVWKPDVSSYTPDQKAQYYLGRQNYAAAEDIYKQELKSASSNDAKGQIYVSLATAELDDNDYSHAYQDAVQADMLVPSENTATLAAQAAQQNGDKKNAAKYYQLAIGRLDKSAPEYDFDLSELQTSLKEVSS